MTSELFERLRPTYIENWPEGLRTLSIRQVDIPLTLDDARALGSNIRVFGGRFGPPQSIDAIAARIEAALREFPEGAFVRLGSRSGKDCDFALASGMRVAGTRAALLMLTDGSRGVAWDLQLALWFDYPPHIFVRQWHTVPAWAEFRCFMRARRLLGVSQYDCVNLGARPEIAANAEVLFEAIRKFFAQFREAAHLDDVVFDVFVEPETFRVRLLELNPLLPMSGACLYRWDAALPDGGDFDGSFRYLKA